MTRKQTILFRVLFFLYIAAVLVLCFARFDNNPDIPRSFLGIPMDKLVHFLMFFPFPILAFLAFDQYTNSIPASLAFFGITLLVGCLLAVGTEWGQSTFTDYRCGDRKDLLADFLALGISSVLVTSWDIFKQRRPQK